MFVPQPAHGRSHPEPCQGSSAWGTWGFTEQSAELDCSDRPRAIPPLLLVPGSGPTFWVGNAAAFTRVSAQKSEVAAAP